MINFPLIRQLASNDLRARYRGSVMGQLWLIITPLVSLLLYSVVFSTIFQARWEFLGASVYTNYAMVLFPGLMMYQLMMDALQKGANAFEAYSGLTSKIKISTVDLMLGSLLASVIPFWITLALWYVIAAFLFGISVHGIIIVILSTLLFSVFCIGLLFLSAVIGALFKDWMQIIAMVSLGFLFISPVLYPVDHLPATFQKVIYLNPLSHFVDVIRQGAFQQQLGVPWGLLVSISIMAGISTALGMWLQNVMGRFGHD